jgi:hypothetical protein
MRKLLTLALAMGLVAFAVGTQQANAQGNPGFETAPTGMAGDWTTFAGGGAALHSTADPHSGTGHMDLQLNGVNAFAGVFQNLQGVVINPGDTVTLSGFHKSLVDPFNATREVKIEWTGAPQLRVDELVIPTTYTQFSLQGVAPAGTTGVTVTYAISSFGPGQGESNVLLDDISVDIKRIPEPTSLMLGLAGVLGLVGAVRRRS